MQAIGEFLDLTVIGTPRAHGSLTMFPVLGPGRGDAPGYLTLDEARASAQRCVHRCNQSLRRDPLRRTGTAPRR